MKITDAFLGEHGVFYAQFTHMEKTLPAEETLGPVSVQATLLAAALKTHANLEEELLFVSLEPHIGSQGGPLAVMRAEHDEIENGLARLPQLQDLAEARNLLLHVIQVAREHFAKEERILYPAAKQVLAEDKLTELGAEWGRRRKVVI